VYSRNPATLKRVSVVVLIVTLLQLKTQFRFVK